MFLRVCPCINRSPCFSCGTALYFGLTTLTTVGFGDITPITPLGRTVVSFSILFGITIIPVQLSSLASALINDRKIDIAVADAAGSADMLSSTLAPSLIGRKPAEFAESTDDELIFAECLAVAMVDELMNTLPQGVPLGTLATQEEIKIDLLMASRRAVDRANKMSR